LNREIATGVPGRSFRQVPNSKFQASWALNVVRRTSDISFLPFQKWGQDPIDEFSLECVTYERLGERYMNDSINLGSMAADSANALRRLARDLKDLRKLIEVRALKENHRTVIIDPADLRKIETRHFCRRD
jgi:hypothetical protein